MPWNCLFFLLSIFNIYLSFNQVSTTYEPQVAFLCGKPSKVFKNNQWILDFQQDCIKDEVKVVKFCQKSFPSLKILTAEPAITKAKFTNWCDFKNQNCEVNVEIRPFKCLDKNFQSDALILPRNCQFGHLFNESECLIYKDWVKRATNQCLQKQDWIIKSYGMLFPCGNHRKEIKPMFFKGVEFVCCPRFEPKHTENVETNVLKDYLKNGVLETEQGEQNFYEEAEKRLVQSEKEKESGIIESFKESEKSIDKLWKSDPENAKDKEKTLHSDFKSALNSIQTQFEENKEQLLIYHDDRLEFIFNTKLISAQKVLDEILKNPNKTENEIYDGMKAVLRILLDRKKFILVELEEALKLKRNIVVRIDKQLNNVDSLISQLFDKLKMVPNLESVLKRRLMYYFTEIYPKIGKPIDTQHSIYGKMMKMNSQDIIEKYRHRSRNGEFSVHYDLGLNDPDQPHVDLSKWENLARHENHGIHYSHGKSLLGIILGVLCATILILIIAFVIRQRRQGNNGYLKPKFHNEESRKMYHGFGANNTSNSCNFSKPHFYENMNYVTMHDQPLIHTKLENVNEIKHEETSKLNADS